ncbi:hypothetical protein [Pseudomonas sp. Pseu.R1]|uniref:hypothetical protein n=1 Tax=Pseudomonas sp. Pseu.R1 TaxID=3379818 RepID=UPI003B960287
MSLAFNFSYVDGVVSNVRDGKAINLYDITLNGYRYKDVYMESSASNYLQYTGRGTTNRLYFGRKGKALVLMAIRNEAGETLRAPMAGSQMLGATGGVLAISVLVTVFSWIPYAVIFSIMRDGNLEAGCGDAAYACVVTGIIYFIYKLRQVFAFKEQMTNLESIPQGSLEAYGTHEFGVTPQRAS